MRNPRKSRFALSGTREDLSRAAFKDFNARTRFSLPSFLSFREDRLHDYFPLRLSFVRQLILLLRFFLRRFFPSNDSSRSKKADEHSFRPESFCSENPERRSGTFEYNWISNFIRFNNIYVYCDIT